MTDALPLAPAPELVFGLVGPIGVDLELVITILTEALEAQQYEVEPLRITTLMREVPASITIHEKPYIDSIRSRISYANEVREVLERNDAMAILAISAIRELRAERGNEPETPLAQQAYIIRQF